MARAATMPLLVGEGSIASQGQNMTVLQKQIDGLGERMERGFDEIKTIMRGFDDRVRGVETQQAGCGPMLNSRMDAAWRQIDQHEMDLKTLKDVLQNQATAIQELTQTNKILRWILGVATSVLIAILIKLMAGI